MRSRPTWQLDECPAWCSVEHAEGDHPDDRVHRSPGVAVPVVARRTSFEGAGIVRGSEAAELEVALARVDGESQTWLYAGEGPRSAIEVTVESAERLAAVIEAVLRSR
ncbi:MAG: hypothetical protein BGO97_13885 [Micrococcales bacterium 70-64]|nr:hypothetical protein [Leifsonia sp.]ODU65018.1 MAG: hypothetical protein ABT06_13885 [Leifsonia sp. SCN 70-46]OJX86709.1 MAG: hypothetical protein BGO97_13885 [Micrococcales bacterium 70-64]